MIYQDKLNTTRRDAGSRRTAGWLLLLVIAVMYLAWPGDNHWGDLDQALYVNLALQANQEGQLSSCWRQGNAGLGYHPFPIWIYQFFLSLTHDLVMISFAKSLVSLVICLGGLYYLSRVLAYPAWVVLLFCFSPYGYLYGSEFTDDSWLVPVSLMVFVCYARFYEKQTLAAFAGIVFFLVLSIYLHPRGVILFFPVIITLAIFDRQRLKKKVAGLVLVLSAAALIIVPYLMHGVDPAAGGFQRPLVSLINRAAHFLSALVSGSLFFSYDLFQLILPFDYISRPLAVMTKVLIGITMISYLLVISGISITVVRLIKAHGSGAQPVLEDRLGGLALFSVFVFSAVIAFLNLFNTVEYYSIVWFCFFFFIWRAVKTFQRRKYLKLLVGAYVISMTVSWIGMWLVIHFGEMGLTLGNAVAAAQQISRYSPESRVVQTVNLKYGNLVDIMNNNLEKSFGNVWYYKENVDFINQSELLRNCLKGEYVYITLVPLLNIYYAGRDLKALPVRTIALDYQVSGSKNRLIVTAYPEGVILE